MRLLFDLYATQSIGRHKYNGGSEYVQRIFVEILERCDESTEIFCTHNSRYPLNEDLRQLCQENGIDLLDIAEIGIDQHVRENGIDRLYLGIVQRYGKLELDNRVEVILVCHDIRDLEVFPTRKSLWNLSDVSSIKNRILLITKWMFLELFLLLRIRRVRKTYENMLYLVRRENTSVITDSTHTKYMMLSQFDGVDASKIRLCWAPEITYATEKDSCSEVVGRKFWLLLSADRWEKNALPVIEGLININKSRLEKVNLVLVGNLENTVIHRKIKNIEWITSFEYLDRRNLEWLYANCEVFLYPSFAEGFGYPPIEAMKYDKPVLASATSSIMEVCGDAPVYMCPYNDMEIEARLRSLLELNLEALASRSRVRYRQIVERQERDLVSIVDTILS